MKLLPAAAVTAACYALKKKPKPIRQVCMACRETCCAVRLALQHSTKNASDLRQLQKGTGGVLCASVLSVAKPTSRHEPCPPMQSKYALFIHTYRFQ